jgi:hypothetical protein
VPWHRRLALKQRPEIVGSKHWLLNKLRQFDQVGMLLFTLMPFGKNFFEPVRLSLRNPLVTD